MPRLTLSFDNGPTPGATERILDILKERGLKATFFLVGNNLADAAGRRLAERAAQEGHWLGNHTMTHGEPLGLRHDAGHVEQEIAATQALLGPLAHADRFFRPVGGGGKLGPHLLSPAAADYLIANRYTVVTWNNVPRDWLEPKRDWVARALDIMAAQDWSLIVLHDFALDVMMDTLETFLDRAEAARVEIVQAFPDSCVPLLRGERRPALEGFIAAGSPG